MECLKSFSVRILTAGNLDGTAIKTWVSGTETFWSMTNPGVSTFNIQGFKNVNIYGARVVGNFSTLTGSAVNGIIVNDWSVNVQINGILPILGGFVTTSPNNYSIGVPSLNNKIFPLGKYTNYIEFANPIESVTDIQFQDTNANGFGYQNALALNCAWNMNFIFYYKFEGED